MDEQKKQEINTDLLVAIWALKKLGFSNRAIANLRNEWPTSHPTIAKYNKIACEKIEIGEVTISRKNSKVKREIYVGSSNSLQQLYAKEHQRQTGGGWQTPKRNFNINEQ